MEALNVEKKEPAINSSPNSPENLTHLIGKISPHIPGANPKMSL